MRLISWTSGVVANKNDVEGGLSQRYREEGGLVRAHADKL
jgi:hypothetical protein